MPDASLCPWKPLQALLFNPDSQLLTEKAMEWLKKAEQYDGAFAEGFHATGFGQELHGYDEANVAVECGLQVAEARAVLRGEELEDRVETFKVLDWMVANGRDYGARRIEEKLYTSAKRTDANRAEEIAWILGSDPTTPLSKLTKRAFEAGTRYNRLSSNLQILGGHVKPVSEADLEKEKLFAQIECLSCGCTAVQAGLERLKRCSGCKSSAVAYCSAECQRKDFSGQNGIHGVAMTRRNGMTECKQIAAAIAKVRS